METSAGSRPGAVPPSYALLFPARGWKRYPLSYEARAFLLRFTLPRKGMETHLLKGHEGEHVVRVTLYSSPQGDGNPLREPLTCFSFELRFTLPRKGMETSRSSEPLNGLLKLRFTLPRKGMETSRSCRAPPPPGRVTLYSSPQGDGNWNATRWIHASRISYALLFPARGWKLQRTQGMGLILKSYALLFPARGWKLSGDSEYSWELSGYALLFPARGWKLGEFGTSIEKFIKLRFTLPRKGMETSSVVLVRRLSSWLRFTLPRKGMET